MDSILRKCNECGIEARHEEELLLFEKAKTSKYGRLNLCTACRKARDASYYAGNKDIINKRNYEYRHSEHGHSITEEYRKSEIGLASRKAYETSEKGKAKATRAIKKYRDEGNGKKVAREAAARYNKKPEHRHKLRALWAKRRADELQRTPKWLTEDDFWLIEQAYTVAQERTEKYSIQFHVDHIIPLRGKYVSGFHCPENLQVIPWYENISKSNKYEVA